MTNLRIFHSDSFARKFFIGYLLCLLVSYLICLSDFSLFAFLIYMYIRERMVASLISLGAAPGALTDPTTKYPTGETPADLASEQGHKGIAGYLAESALSAHLSSLNLDIKEGNSAEISGGKAVSASSRDGELTDGLSLRDSLTAVCNATQAAARIHQVFRVQSFQRKQMKEYNGDKFGISNERALSLIGVKAHKAGKRDQQVDAAAIRIQNKFRSWKGRKDYLIIRQRIVKIQVYCHDVLLIRFFLLLYFLGIVFPLFSSLSVVPLYQHILEV